MLYLHGVKGTRARTYRVGVYNILLKLGFKVQSGTLHTSRCNIVMAGPRHRLSRIRGQLGDLSVGGDHGGGRRGGPELVEEEGRGWC